MPTDFVVASIRAAGLRTVAGQQRPRFALKRDYTGVKQRQTRDAALSYLCPISVFCLSDKNGAALLRDAGLERKIKSKLVTMNSERTFVGARDDWSVRRLKRCCASLSPQSTTWRSRGASSRCASVLECGGVRRHRFPRIEQTAMPPGSRAGLRGNGRQ